MSNFEQKIKAVMAAYPGSAPHRDIDVPLGPFRSLADALEKALCVPQLMLLVDASYGHGLVSVVALIGPPNRLVWRLTAHCASHSLIPEPHDHAKHKLFDVTVSSGLICTDADKPGQLCRTLEVECDDLTGLADYLMQYVDDARFGAELIALRKIALGASVHENMVALRKVALRRAEKPGEGNKRVEPTIDLGQGDPRADALTRLQAAVEDAIAEVPSTAALRDQSLANLRDAINIAKIVDADLCSWEAAQNVLWSIEHTIEHKKRFDGHVKEALEGTEEVSECMELDLWGEKT